MNVMIDVRVTMRPLVLDDQRPFEQSVLRTVLYSDLFDYALTPAEIARYLICCTATTDQVQAALDNSIWLNERVVQIEGYVVAQGREALVQRRLDRSHTSDRLWVRARRLTHVLSLLPFVRMIGVTGALAMNNASATDDIDVMIVTPPDRVWLTRALAVGLVYVGKLFGDTLCPNYVISERVLALENHSLFVAHEFSQMVPVYGFDVYARLVCANEWIATWLPNAARDLPPETEQRLSRVERGIKRGLEWLLSGRLGAALERWEMQRKIRKFQPQLGHPDGDAVLDRDHVKGHFDDYGGPVMRLYAERLAQYET